MKEGMLAAFDSTQQALRAELLLDYAGIDLDIMPTPKEITAGCAISIAFPAADLGRVMGIFAAERVEHAGIYRLREGVFVKLDDQAKEDGREDEPWK